MDKVDIVFSTEKTIQDLLLNKFDLPCVRVAIDCDENYIVSAQFIASLFTGTYYLPAILKSMGKYVSVHLKDYIKKNFPSVCDQIILNASKMDNGGEAYKSNAIDFKYLKLSNRIEKYSNRGFNPIYIGENIYHSLFNPKNYTITNYI
jgi:hypothetical protein